MPENLQWLKNRSGVTNEEVVLRSVALARRPIPRSEIAHYTGLHLATVSRASKLLIARGLTRESDPMQTPGKLGPKFIGLEMNTQVYRVIGVSINAYEQKLSVADLSNQILLTIDLEIDDVTDVSSVIKAVSGRIAELVESEFIGDWTSLLGVTLAVSGVVDRIKGCVLRARVLGWELLDVKSELSKLVPCPISLISLPDAIHLAEQLVGVARGSRRTLLINAALGIGSSLSFDDQLVTTNPERLHLIGDVICKRGGVKQEAMSIDMIAGGRGVIARVDTNPKRARLLSPSEASRKIKKLIQQNFRDQRHSSEFYEAGAALGEISTIMLATVNPESMILSGPLSGVDSYYRGWRESIEASFNDASDLIHRSEIDNVSAATLCAIEHHVLTSSQSLSGSNSLPERFYQYA
jgi:predicted NBD/HSP70 family sugar kinase